MITPFWFDLPVRSCRWPYIHCSFHVRLQLCEDMTWEAGERISHVSEHHKKVQSTACSPGLTAGFAPQACMSGGQWAVKWAIPVSTSLFATVFAPLPLLKQGRNLVGNYKNVMGKKLGESLFCSGLRVEKQGAGFSRSTCIVLTVKTGWGSQGWQSVAPAHSVQEKSVRKRDCSSDRNASLRIPANAQIVSVTSFSDHGSGS